LRTAQCSDPRVIALRTHQCLTQHVHKLLSPLERTGEVIRPRAVIPSYQSHRSHWHQDVTKPGDSRDGLGSVRLACWIPLSDVNEDEGALEVIPGNWAEPLPHGVDATGRILISDDQLPSAPRTCVSLLRGDVLILDRFIPHRGLASWFAKGALGVRDVGEGKNSIYRCTVVVPAICRVLVWDWSSLAELGRLRQ
jgi:Phytanoyl-CoA dioxygenase (PhyH)